MQVQLDISYKSKIDAGAVVLCTAEVESLEGRKLWMKVGWRMVEPSGVLARRGQPGGRMASPTRMALACASFSLRLLLTV